MSTEQRRQQQHSNVDYSSRGHQAQDQEQHDYEPFTQKLYHSAPSTRQTVKFLTATTIGTVLLILSGLILTGTVLSLILSTPLLVLFSPILIPAAITVFLLASGFLFSGGCGVAALSALSWIYKYVTGQHPVGADQLDRARMRIGDAAWDVKEKAKENLQYVQPKAHEATHHQQTTPTHPTS